MNQGEKIDQLRKDLAKYHVEVREHIARAEATAGAVEALQLDVYGVPGEKDDESGLIAAVQSLKHSRRVMSIGLRCIWAVLLAAGGAVVSVFAPRW